MEKRQNNKIKRSAVSGRIINGKEVILTSEAVDYLMKNGYIFVDENEISRIDKVIDKLKHMGLKVIPSYQAQVIKFLTIIFIGLGGIII